MKLFLLCFAVGFELVGQNQVANDFRVSGIVVDHLTNRPLNHVMVELLGTAKGTGEAYAVTEADGRWNFLHVPAGKYRLTAERPGQPVQGFHGDGAYSTAIVVNGTSPTDNIVFPMRSQGTLSGTVMGDDGDPVRNGQVDLLRRSVVDGEAQVVHVRSGRTNSAGKFHLGHLDAGTYYVAASGTPWYSQPGNGQQQVSYPITFYGDTSDGNSARAIQLPEGGSATIQIDMHTVPSIRVTVPNQQRRGVAIFAPGPGGSRIPVPTMFMGAPDVGVVRPVSGGGPVQPVGQPPEMQITNLAAGRYEISRFAEAGGFDATAQLVDLANGSTLDLGSSAGATVSGTVVFAGNRPEQLAVALGQNQRGGATAEVAADGTFKFPKISSGEYQVHLTTGALTIASLQVRGAKIVGDNVQIPQAGPVEMTIHAVASESLATVEGRAQRGEMPVAAAMILLLPENAANQRLIRRDQSDSDGSFEMPRVVPGRYILLAIDDGHDLAYRSEQVIRPYLTRGVRVTIPLAGNEPLIVPVQQRLR